MLKELDMLIPRVIPVLLLKKEGLVKGTNFKNHTYVGDPINAVKIFNEKEVDELFFVDIAATNENKRPLLELIQKIADECFMPFGVGGGIKTIDDIRMVLSAGAEKICINSAAVENPQFVKEAAGIFGSQSIVVSIDVKRQQGNEYEVYTHSGTKRVNVDLVELAKQVESLGAGEILLTSIDKDGTMQGYDFECTKRVAMSVKIPIVACGGAGRKEDLADVVNEGCASAAAAGSFFVFHGRRRAVLINFPLKQELEQIFNTFTVQ
ncbi:AglZ/HisF2 family acetamidino modification protein [Candidatus Omnitrophota bacterium]